ncbi:hypothetical protein OAJ65_02375 [Flavobacteriales bacterium]|nr:hypothetical protein [Flavobacteriales bacterium]
MKKLLFILLSVLLFFSNCQEDDPSPSANPAPAVCCSFSEPSLNYNPVWQDQTGTGITCDDGTVVTNSSGNITNISTISFTSYCPPSATTEMDWTMSVDLSDMSVTTSPLQEGVTYTMSGNLINEDPLIQCTFLDYNCTTPDVYRNTDLVSGQMNGTMTFNVDWTTNTLSGSFSFILQNVATGTTKLINNCTFSNLPFTHHQI